MLAAAYLAFVVDDPVPGYPAAFWQCRHGIAHLPGFTSAHTLGYAPIGTDPATGDVAYLGIDTRIQGVTRRGLPRVAHRIVRF